MPKYETVCFLAAMFLASTGFGQNAPAIRKLVYGQMARYSRALGNRDAAGVRQVVDPGLRATELSGRVIDFKGFMLQAVQLFRIARNIKMSSEMMSFKLEKESARVRCRQILSFDAPDRKGRIHKYRADFLDDDFWTPSNGNYRLRLSTQLSAKRTIDGTPVAAIQPVPHRPSGPPKHAPSGKSHGRVAPR